MAAAKKTTDHDTIRRWVEERGGVPSTVEGTEQRGEEAGLLRIDFPEKVDAASLRSIDWDKFFRKFEEAALAFLYQEQTADGRLSRFSKFVRRD